jgi:hypothetical protein
MARKTRLQAARELLQEEFDKGFEEMSETRIEILNRIIEKEELKSLNKRMNALYRKAGPIDRSAFKIVKRL